MTTLPLKLESFTGFPSTSLKCQSGAAIFESAAWVRSVLARKQGEINELGILLDGAGKEKPLKGQAEVQQA